MPKITLEVSEELSKKLAQVGDRLPELLAHLFDQLTVSGTYIPVNLRRQTTDVSIASYPQQSPFQNSIC
ncbi:MAG: hypothetical protein V7K27_17780 [Nostoc sp.]